MRSTCFRFFRRVLISGSVRSSFVLVMLIHFCVYHLCARYPIRRSFPLSLLLSLCHPKLITNRILTYLRQATLYKMAQRIIAENAHIQAVTYTLPNKHYIPVDMRYIGVDNLTPLSVLPLLLSLFSHVLCLIVIFLLIVMDDSGYTCCARRYRASTSFFRQGRLMTLCPAMSCSDFIARLFLFMAKLFPLLATLCMHLFLLCRFLCSTSFFLTFSVPAESSLA